MNFEDRMELFFKGLESLKEGLGSLKERHDALTMNLELMSHEIRDLRAAAQQDGENIRALVRIAEIHERRLSDLEGE